MQNKKMTKNISFAAKLAAFMLNAQDHPIRFDEKVGFMNASDYTKGIIPLLHMNINKNEFKSIMYSANGNISLALSVICSSKNLEEKLAFENFNCFVQSNFTANILIDRFIDTIETGYKERSNGKKLVKELAKYQRWQVKNKIINSHSIEWAKGI